MMKRYSGIYAYNLLTYTNKKMHGTKRPNFQLEGLKEGDPKQKMLIFSNS